MSETFEQHSEKNSDAILLHKLEVGLVDIFGQAEAEEHLEFIRELTDVEAVINYIYGALLANGHRPEDILDAIGILELDEKTE